MQKEYIGKNSINNLIGILEQNSPKKIFIVAGKHSYKTSGAKSSIDELTKNYETHVFSNFSSNPQAEDIEKGIEEFNKEDYDIVLAVGGGSAIDVAKIINIIAANTWGIKTYLKKENDIEKKGKPFIAIPTTSGSGSEATHFAVVYLEGTKYSLAHEFILPDYCIVDSQFTMSLPAKITATCGMDALSQAIESYWCVNSTDESKQYAEEAIRLVLENLENTVNNPDEESRKNMALAAHLAGKAINITKTTACHAVSYPITSYFGISHGQAVGLTIPPFILYNYDVSENDVLDVRGAEYVKSTMKNLVHIMGCKSASDVAEKISGLMESIGLKTKLSELGIDEKDIDIIVNNGFNPDRVKNNPRILTEKTLKNILISLI